MVPRSCRGDPTFNDGGGPKFAITAGPKFSSKARSTTVSGSSASCTTIWATSIWSKKPCNPSTTRSAPGCHPYLRNRSTPMCPVWTAGRWCPRRDSNPRPQDSSHHGLRRRHHPRCRSWAGLSLHPLPPARGARGRQVPPVQSLHRPRHPRGLARDRPDPSGSRRSPTLSGSTAEFPTAAPSSATRNPVLYPAELRGHRGLL